MFKRFQLAKSSSSILPCGVGWVPVSNGATTGLPVPAPAARAAEKAACRMSAEIKGFAIGFDLKLQFLLILNEPRIGREDSECTAEGGLDFMAGSGSEPTYAKFRAVACLVGNCMGGRRALSHRAFNA